MIVYLLVTNDKYELPIIVAESKRELMEKSGLSYSTIRKHLIGAVIKPIIFKIEVDEE